ncbi:MAG: helix-turn-helix domain-containing protein [Myxococcales bacterium]|nr:helix-turn-helix domain-containing protein [Myxococcales bacterium]
MRETTFRKKFGQALRAAREAAGLSQRELAERADIADKYLSRVELGASSVSLFVAWQLANALDLELSALTQFEANDEASPRAAIAELLRDRSPDAIARALRVLRALEDP